MQFQYHISLEFLKLHQFLHGKEKMYINQLKEEGEILLQEMEANLNKLQDQTQSAKDTLVCIQARLYQQNSAGFLKVRNLDLTVQHCLGYCPWVISEISSPVTACLV